MVCQKMYGFYWATLYLLNVTGLQTHGTRTHYLRLTVTELEYKYLLWLCQ